MVKGTIHATAVSTDSEAVATETNAPLSGLERPLLDAPACEGLGAAVTLSAALTLSRPALAVPAQASALAGVETISG
jgi:hypothetical protein